MCNQACVEFGNKHLRREDIKGKRIIEVGAIDVNGSLRSTIDAFSPAEYIGVDIQPGKGVDRVCRAEDLLESFGYDRFDVLIATELLEHVGDWKKVISNFKRILKPNGIIIITTRSAGFGYHGFPFDFWRYEISDMERIFSDFIIEIAEKDPSMPGVFIRAKKPEKFVENNLNDCKLYSVEFGKRSTITAAAFYFPLFFILRLIRNEWPDRVKQTTAYKKFKSWKRLYS